MTDADTAAVVDRVLQQMGFSMREAPAPPPVDLEAEEWIASGLLDGQPIPKGLEATDFFLPVHQLVYFAAEQAERGNLSVSPETVSALGARLGYCDIREPLERLVALPYRQIGRDECLMRVVRFSRRRALLRVLEQMSALLRIPDVPACEIGRLAKLLVEATIALRVVYP